MEAMTDPHDLHDIEERLLRTVSGTAHERRAIIMTALDVFAAREELRFAVTGQGSASAVTAIGEGCDTRSRPS